VLLLGVGGSDDVPAVMDASKWPTNLGSELVWGFKAQPNSALHGRALSMSVGKVLDGIADGSIMPRITTGNTMAPCVVIGERVGEMLKAARGI
jgi:hypothetical protein